MRAELIEENLDGDIFERNRSCSDLTVQKLVVLPIVDFVGAELSCHGLLRCMGPDETCLDQRYVKHIRKTTTSYNIARYLRGQHMISTSSSPRFRRGAMTAIT